MSKKYKYLIVTFLIVASFIVYAGILDNGFINFDDNEYITDNDHIKSGINPESIKWAFGAVVCSNWHPLTLLSHIIDWSLFGANASGHHLINLLLHIGSVLFLFFFLNRMTKNLWPSAFVAALLALHPLRVESVAWAAERKDVLSMFFGLASIYAYACYVESYKLSRYFLCLILFALSLMSKPMLVTLPFILLLLDYWPLGRWQKVPASVNDATVFVNKKAGKEKNKQRKADSIKSKNISASLTNRSSIIYFLLWEKAPLVILTILSSIVTIRAQNKGGAVASMTQMSFPARVANAIVSYVSYLGKIFWPVDLAVFYPYKHSFLFVQIIIYCFVLIGITIVVIYAVKKLPFLFVGWFWYLGTLIPVIGLVQVGIQAMADRYTYLPSIGIAIMLAWGISSLMKSKEIRKKILFPAQMAVIIILAVLTWQQCGYWKNSIELFNHALQVTKDNDLAHNNRGSAYADLGQYQLAIKDFNKAIDLNHKYIKAYNNRGIVYGELGQYQMAIEDFDKAIILKPDYVDAYYNRGTIYGELGQYRQAIENYDKVINLNQDCAAAYNNRGNAYLMQGNYTLGCDDAQKACVLGGCKELEWAKSKGLCR
jgi:tetratricopeptide (TPR) repeat protein